MPRFVTIGDRKGASAAETSSTPGPGARLRSAIAAPPDASGHAQ